MWILILLIGLILILLAMVIWLVLSTKRNMIISVAPNTSALAQNIQNSRMVGGSNSKYIVPYITQPVDQHECNACWAIAVCQAMSDRMRLRKEIPINDQLNFYAFHDMITENDPSEDCASGALLDTGMNMSVSHGAPLMSQSMDRVFDDNAPSSDFNTKMYKAKGWRQIKIQGPSGTNIPATIEAIKQEIKTNGSVVAVLNLYDSFENFLGNTVYKPNPSERTDPNMAHMLSIVGYDDSTNSWIVRNSYGPSWGMNGFGKVQRGNVQLDIENYVYAPII